jgi:predicted enzyme related to lactoylglutathione lyase
MAPLLRKVSTIWVHVRDVRKARRFYREFLGLKELEYQNRKSDAFAVYRIPGGPRFGLHRMEAGCGREPGTVTGVYFQVRDVRKVAKRIRKGGGRVTLPPKKGTTGKWWASVTDPEGNEFVLHE